MHQATRGPLPTQRGSRRSAMRAAVLVVGAAVAAVLSACGASTPSGDVRMGSADGDAIEVVAIDNAFEPAVLELEAGEEVTIEISNDGAAAHNLVIDELDLSTGTLKPGDVATATFVAPDGPVRFVCTFHRGMDGEIRLATG